MSRVLTICFGMALALFCAQPALAGACATGLPAGDVCYDLNVPTIGGGKFYAQVAIQQLNSNPVGDPSADKLQVTVTLSDASLFAQTGGPHQTFAFSLSGPALPLGAPPTGDFTVCPNTCTASQWTQVTGSASTAFGTFDYTINLTSSGTSGNVAGPLVFDITASGITAASFIKSTGSGGGFLFAADVCSPAIGTGGSCTGEVAAEPATPFMFGAGLLALMMLYRRRLPKPARSVH